MAEHENNGHGHDAAEHGHEHEHEHAETSSAGAEAGAPAARSSPDLFVTGMFLVLGLGLIAGASVLVVWGSVTVARWSGLSELHLLLAFAGLLTMVLAMVLATSVWRSLRQLHERVVTLAEQQQAMLLLLARHTGITIEGLPERGAQPRRPRRGLRH